jgi:hypothetical protein
MIYNNNNDKSKLQNSILDIDLIIIFLDMIPIDL